MNSFPSARVSEFPQTFSLKLICASNYLKVLKFPELLLPSARGSRKHYSYVPAIFTGQVHPTESVRLHFSNAAAPLKEKYKKARINSKIMLFD